MERRQHSKQWIKRAARHEAGHAITYLVRERKFLCVWVRRTTDEIAPFFLQAEGLDSGAGGGLIPSGEGEYIDGETLVLGAVGGVAGERVGRKSAGTWDSEACDTGFMDRVQAAKYINENNKWVWTPEMESDFVNQSLESAWRIIRRYRKAHRALTNKLIEEGMVTYEDAVEIFREAQR